MLAKMHQVHQQYYREFKVVKAGKVSNLAIHKMHTNMLLISTTSNRMNN